MDNFISPVSFGGAAVSGQGGVQQNIDADKAFSSLFLQTMLKEIYKNQFKNNLFSGGNDASASYFSEMFAEQLINEIAETDAFGIGNMISSGMKTYGGKTQGQDPGQIL